MIMAILLLVIVFLTPFNLAFDKYNDPSEYPAYFILLNTIDAFFWADFLVQFFLVTEKDDGSLEDDRKEIVIRYLKGWFSIDFTSNFPFDKVIEVVQGNKPGKYNSLVRTLRIGKFYRIVKMTKLLRITKMLKSRSKFFEKLASFFTCSEGFQRLSFTLLMFIMIAHFMGCFWIFTADLSLTETVNDDGELVLNGTNWINANGF